MINNGLPSLQIYYECKKLDSFLGIKKTKIFIKVFTFKKLTEAQKQW